MHPHRPLITHFLFVLIGMLVSTEWLPAQSVRFSQPGLITDQQGLPQAFVPAILQDKQGFIWAATRDGLCRYDGYRFKVFQPDPDGRTSLSFAGLNHIELDQHGRIWIVSERGEIDVFDPRTETFTNFSRQEAFRRLVKPNTTYGLYIDRRDRLWLTVIGDGVIYWDIKKNQGHWFHHQPKQTESISSNGVYDVSEGADGTIWLATANGLDRFEEATLTFRHLRHQPGNPQSLPEDSLVAVHLRPTGEMMLFSQHYLTLLQPHTGQLRSYRLPVQGGVRTAIDRQGTIYFGQANRLFRFTDQEGIVIVTRWDKQHNESCTSLFIDRTNVLWIGTAGAGIRTYDLQPNPFQRHQYRRGFYQDLLTNDSLGLPPLAPAVLATLSGLSSYNFRSTFDASGRFWFNVGSSDLYRLDRKSSKTEHFPLPVRFRAVASNHPPCPMTTDPQGRVWAVYDSVAFWLNKQTRQWVRFPFPIPGQLDNPITELVVDAQALWLASRSGGLWRVDRQTGQTRQFVNRPGDPTSLSSNSLYCLSADPADANRLWIGTFGNGLCLFDKRTGQFRRFTQANGLPNNVVYSAKPDPYGYLWIGTNKGLCRMNRRTFTTQTFTRDDGILADEFNRSHYVQFPDGKLLMGGLEGFTVFHPRQICQDTFEPTIELTGLQINNQLIQPDRPAANRPDTTTSAHRSILGTLPIQATNQLTLAYNQNYLTVQFAALQFNRPAKNRYRYRLDGLEETWKETTRPEAIYTNLPPGDYVLMLNASNTSGQWSSHVRRLAITIESPVWATWSAYLVYGLLIVGIGYGLIRNYVRRLQMQQSITLKEKENALQHKEIIVQQQQAEQRRAVDTLKTNFFTNITHEFRTPLTLILGPAEQMVSENPDLKNRRRLQTIEQNAHQLLRLINQLLDLSKLEASVMPIHESRGDLTEFISHWLRPLTEQAIGQGLSLNFMSEVVGDYWFDAEKLERIVYNLTANALKFTRAGTITVSLAVVSERIHLTVTDTGVGIPAQHLPYIFDRFYQVGDTAITPGTGIGLALVHELVQLQGGQISVVSHLDQGTTFVVELPYRPAEVLETAPDLSAVVGLPHHRHSGAVVAPSRREANDAAWTAADQSDQPRLLVVEDNDELARFIADSLPGHYRIRRAVNGRDGLEQALEHLPDLIISDVMMPLMDGFTLCGQLKTDLRSNHIPIILLTAKASVDNRLAGLALGADEYLTKPFQVTELQLRVRNQLEHTQRLRDKLRAELTQIAQTVADQSAPITTNPFMEQLYNVLDEHLDNSDFVVDDLLKPLGMSRMVLYRKIRALTGMAPADVVRLYRLKQAARFLLEGLSVAETAYRIGYQTPSHFTKVFREQYQMTPTQFIRQASTL